MLLFSCNLFQKNENENENEKMEFIVKGDSFTISWDYGSLNTSNYVNKAAKYKIYYRIHGNNSWTFLDEIISENNLEYTITDKALDYGIYDLGVSSVNIKDAESEIHSSLDLTADPFSGWYINWIYD